MLRPANLPQRAVNTLPARPGALSGNSIRGPRPWARLWQLEEVQLAGAGALAGRWATPARPVAAG